jgi:DNA ligase (NAD+)
MTDSIERMRELIAQIKEADTAYYKHDRPQITDRLYDEMVDELKEIEASTGINLSGSPTQYVPGELLETLEKVEHTRPMLSADRTKSMDDVEHFILSLRLRQFLMSM